MKLEILFFASLFGMAIYHVGELRDVKLSKEAVAFCKEIQKAQPPHPACVKQTLRMLKYSPYEIDGIARLQKIVK